MCLVTYPWYEFDIQAFLNGSSEMQFWLKLEAKEKLILITDWMACLASGLSALHKKIIKRKMLCLLGDRMIPVISILHYQKTLRIHSSGIVHW
jgi:hypothetical protein